MKTPGAGATAAAGAAAGLRAQLRERFPEAHALRAAGGAGSSGSSGALGQLGAAEQLGEIFPPAALTELVASAAGGGLVLADLLAGLGAGFGGEGAGFGGLGAGFGGLGAGQVVAPLALIDVFDGFDPASFGDDCQRVLWVRCAQLGTSLKVADLLLRDGNLPWVLLDVAGLAERELRAVPGSAWHRLHGLARARGARLLVMTSFPLIPKPALRVFLEEQLGLEDLDRHAEEWAGRGIRAVAAARQAAGAQQPWKKTR